MSLTVYDRDTTQIRAKVGEQFAVRLAASPSTGYDWDADFDSAILELASHHYGAPSSAAFGAASTKQFVFKAKVASTTTLQLHHRRSFSGQQSEKLTIEVIVTS
jgi:predicted secreted protein